MKKKICIITSNRAEFGQLENLMYQIKKSKKSILQLVVTGTHLEKKFGFTLKEIKKKKYKVSSLIKLKIKNNKNKEIEISKYLLGKVANCLTLLKPDIVVILGDRYEMLSIAQCCLFLKIPLAHLHGGEITRGVIDDTIRHLITKMSDLHFVANDKFKKVVLLLGENPKNIYNFGSLTAENISKIKFKKINILEKQFNLKFREKNILVSLHPVRSSDETKKILESLEKIINFLKDTQFIFSAPNFDENYQLIYSFIIKHEKKSSNVIFVKSFGYQNYLSIMKNVDCIIGNSSSGIIEAPLIKTPTINIGTRQAGRPTSKSVINVNCGYKNILNKIKILCLRKNKFESYYFKTNTSRNILNILENKNLNKIKNKYFFEKKDRINKF